MFHVNHETTPPVLSEVVSSRSVPWAELLFDLGANTLYKAAQKMLAASSCDNLTAARNRSGNFV